MYTSKINLICEFENVLRHVLKILLAFYYSLL